MSRRSGYRFADKDMRHVSPHLRYLPTAVFNRPMLRL
jgi:hypothetical protein